MINSTLIELLRTLNKGELKKLDEMVISPYFNKKSAVIKFWKAVKKYAPAFDTGMLTHEELYKEIFPGQVFNYGTLKNLIYEMTKLTEKFLELESSDKRPIQKYENFLEMLMEKGLNKHFEKHFKLAVKLIEESTDEVQYYNRKHSYENLWQNYLIINDKHYETFSSISESNKYITLAYFTGVIINNYNAVFMKKEISSGQKDDGDDFIKKAIAYFKTRPVQTDYITEIYYNAFMLIYEGGDENFHDLRRLLNENNDKLSSEQKYNFYVALANYCGERAEGSAEFARHECDVYRFMIENSIYSINYVNTVDGSFYRKAAAAAAGAGEFEWALEFINKFKPMLEEGVRENYYHHAMVEYFLKLKDFTSALEHLSRIKHTNRLDKLNIKTWQMICYYELRYFEELRGVVDSTRHFISSEKKILESRKEKLYNFISVISRLINAAENKKDSESAAMIIRELENMNISNKNWFKEKAEELL
jgi:hypothetical protein